MSDPNQLNCLCYWTGEPGASWRRRAWQTLRARAHRLRHDRQLAGQSPEDFERHTMQLAHTFEVQRVRVVVARPGRIWLEFTHRDGLTDIVPTLTRRTTRLGVDLMGLPVGLL